MSGAGNSNEHLGLPARVSIQFSQLFLERQRANKTVARNAFCDTALSSNFEGPYDEALPNFSICHVQVSVNVNDAALQLDFTRT